MLFNSFEFIFIFLPVTVIIYFIINYNGLFKLAKIWILITSLFFYGWWNPKYILLIITSILINFFFFRLIKKISEKKKKKCILVLGISFNVIVLGYYKYVDFFIENINSITGTHFNLVNIILPLGISFFTFQQIAFLVDSYLDRLNKINLLDYSVFVSFFPQLIAGPIVHHSEMMPQFSGIKRKFFNAFNVSKGLLIFNIGLAKKVIIADTFGKIANIGYSNTELLDFVGSWVTAFSYTIQLYFDFSGYSDMAIGIALLFNISIPINFNSPYKSENVQEFFRRWHITLSRFLRDYIYVPLGGNRKGGIRTYVNLLMTFLIGGFWHGANWTFVFWGGLNGCALIIHRVYQKIGFRMPRFIAVSVTFIFIMVTWVYFRANEWQDATNILCSMIGLKSGEGVPLFATYLDSPIWIIGVILLFGPNSNQIGDRFKTNSKFLFLLIYLFIVNILFLNSSIKKDFLYFDF